MSIVLKSKDRPVAVPNGIYTAKLTNIKQFHNTYGDRIGFEFTIQGGAEDGQKVLRTTSVNLRDQSKLCTLLETLLGRSLSAQEIHDGFDVEDLIGAECNILVIQSKGKNGQLYSNVEQVFRD